MKDVNHCFVFGFHVESGTKNRLKSNLTIKNFQTKGLDKKLRVFMGDDQLSKNFVAVNIQLIDGSWWVPWTDKQYVDSFGCATPKTLLKL